MPIYEFACPNCRTIFSFLSKRINPDHAPTCPKCGSEDLAKQVSGFAMLRAGSKSAEGEEDGGPDDASMPDLDDPKIMRAMGEIERDMAHMDENNPRHMAHMMRRMKEIMPEGALPKEMDVAIRRLEAGEDPEKIEEDMGDILGELTGEGDDMGYSAGGGYTRDPGLYDY